MMTSRERIEAAFDHREPDRTPYFEYVLLSPVADELLGRPYAVDPGHWPALLDERGWEGAVRQIAVDRLDLACLLGHDMMYVTPNPLPGERDISLHMPPAVASPDPVARVRHRNQAAAANPAPPADNRLLVYVLLGDEMRRRGVDLPILAPAYAHGIWTDVDLMMAMRLAPEVAHEHFRLATQRALRSIARYVELGIDLIGVGGDFAGNRPLISPADYRAFIVPEVRACARRIHAAGRRAVNASDGDLWSVIDDYLIGCEVDGYLEIDYHAGMDLARLKAAYGAQMTFLGNLDCGNVLSVGSPAEVRRHVLDCLHAGRGDGGHVLCASNAITASVPLENYYALVSAYRERFGLPPLSV
jgi:Uroporphyrinogen decarboxylase (URO-D)